MKIAVIDADLIGRKRHRFPNLACMKLSGYHKDCGNDVTLKTDYDDLKQYDNIYISKVFTDTEVPDLCQWEHQRDYLTVSNFCDHCGQSIDFGWDQDD